MSTVQEIEQAIEGLDMAQMRQLFAWMEEKQAIITATASDHTEDDFELSPTWQAEIYRRAYEWESGVVQPISLEQFRSRIEEKLV